jgi:hypothetical protein
MFPREQILVRIRPKARDKEMTVWNGSKMGGNQYTDFLNFFITKILTLNGAAVLVPILERPILERPILERPFLTQPFLERPILEPTNPRRDQS